MTSLELIVDVLRSVLAAAVIYLSAYGLGRPLLRVLRMAEGDRLAECVWSLALGLVAAGLFLLMLARVGWVYASVIAGVTLVGSLWAIVELVCVYLGWTGGRVLDLSGPDGPSQDWLAPSPPMRLIFALAGAAMLASLVAALAPPTSPHALACSLQIPKNVLLSHASDGGWPGASAATGIAAMWNLWALALDGPVAANLFHWGLGVLVALATVWLARPLLGARLAWLAGSLVMLSPGIQQQMTSPLDDLALALFTALAAGAVFERLRSDGSRGQAIAGGIALGAALAVSPAAISLALALAAVWLAAWWRDQPSHPQVPQDALSLAAAALLTACLGLMPSWPHGLPPEVQSLRSGLAQVGPVLVVACGGMLFARRLRGLEALLGLLAVCLGVAATGVVHARWWSAVVPLASIVAAWVWQEAARLPALPRRLALGACGLLALVTAYGGGSVALDALPVALGRQSRHDFLLTQVGSYRAASLVNRIGRPGDRLLCQDPGSFYFSCLTTSGESISVPAERVSSSGAVTVSRQAAATATPDERPWIAAATATPDERPWIAAARAAGCTYLLTAQRDAADDRPSPARQPASAAVLSPGPAAGKVDATGEVIPILEYRFADDNNRYTRYRLVRLP